MKIRKRYVIDVTTILLIITSGCSLFFAIRFYKDPSANTSKDIPPFPFFREVIGLLEAFLLVFLRLILPCFVRNLEIKCLHCVINKRFLSLIVTFFTALTHFLTLMHWYTFIGIQYEAHQISGEKYTLPRDAKIVMSLTLLSFVMCAFMFALLMVKVLQPRLHELNPNATKTLRSNVSLNKLNSAVASV